MKLIFFQMMHCLSGIHRAGLRGEETVDKLVEVLARWNGRKFTQPVANCPSLHVMESVQLILRKLSDLVLHSRASATFERSEVPFVCTIPSRSSAPTSSTIQGSSRESNVLLILRPTWRRVRGRLSLSFRKTSTMRPRQIRLGIPPCIGSVVFFRTGG